MRREIFDDEHESFRAAVGTFLDKEAVIAKSTEEALAEECAERLARNAPEDGSQRIRIHSLVGELLTMRVRLLEFGQGAVASGRDAQ